MAITIESSSRYQAMNPAQQALFQAKMRKAQQQDKRLQKNNKIIRRLAVGSYTQASAECTEALTKKPHNPLLKQLGIMARLRSALYSGRHEITLDLLSLYEQAKIGHSTEQEISLNHFVDLLHPHTANATSILFIEKRLSALEAAHLRILDDTTKNRIIPKHYSQYLQQARACYAAIGDMQFKIHAQLTKFMFNISTISEGPLDRNTNEQKLLWLLFDETTFLLSKYKLISQYYQILHKQLTLYRDHHSIFSKPISGLIMACQQSSKDFSNTTFPIMAGHINHRMLKSPLRDPTKAYHQLRARFLGIHHPKQPNKTTARSSVTLRHRQKRSAAKAKKRLAAPQKPSITASSS